MPKNVALLLLLAPAAAFAPNAASTRVTALSSFENGKWFEGPKLDRSASCGSATLSSEHIDTPWEGKAVGFANPYADNNGIMPPALETEHIDTPWEGKAVGFANPYADNNGIMPPALKTEHIDTPWDEEIGFANPYAKTNKGDFKKLSTAIEMKNGGCA